MQWRDACVLRDPQTSTCAAAAQVSVTLRKSVICSFAGQVSFLASMDVTTNYLMVRNALYDGSVLAQQPGMALRTYSLSRNVSTLVPFRLCDFDASSFTFTFRVSNVQASTPLLPPIAEHACKAELSHV